MLKTLKNKKAEGYIDTAVSVMILAFVLIFSVSVISVVVLNQNMKAVADQIVDYATFKGTTAIDSYIEGIKTERGLSFGVERKILYGYSNSRNAHKLLQFEVKFASWTYRKKMCIMAL